MRRKFETKTHLTIIGKSFIRSSFFELNIHVD